MPPESIIFNLLLSKTSLLEATKLSKFNKRFTKILRKYSDIISPVKRYTERMIYIYETQNATIAIIIK